MPATVSVLPATEDLWMLSRFAAFVAVCLLLSGCTPTERGLWGFWAATGATDELERAECIIRWESGGRADVVSPTDDHGVFQVNRPTWRRHFGASFDEEVRDPFVNGLMAGEIWLRAGGTWRPWTTAHRC